MEGGTERNSAAILDLADICYIQSFSTTKLSSGWMERERIACARRLANVNYEHPQSERLPPASLVDSS